MGCVADTLKLMWCCVCAGINHVQLMGYLGRNPNQVPTTEDRSVVVFPLVTTTVIRHRDRGTGQGLCVCLCAGASCDKGSVVTAMMQCNPKKQLVWSEMFLFENKWLFKIFLLKRNELECKQQLGWPFTNRYVPINCVQFSTSVGVRRL